MLACARSIQKTKTQKPGARARPWASPAARARRRRTAASTPRRRACFFVRGCVRCVSCVRRAVRVQPTKRQQSLKTIPGPARARAEQAREDAQQPVVVFRSVVFVARARPPPAGDAAASRHPRRPPTNANKRTDKRRAQTLRLRRPGCAGCCCSRATACRAMRVFFCCCVCVDGVRRVPLGAGGSTHIVCLRSSWSSASSCFCLLCCFGRALGRFDLPQNARAFLSASRPSASQSHSRSQPALVLSLAPHSLHAHHARIDPGSSLPHNTHDARNVSTQTGAFDRAVT